MITKFIPSAWIFAFWRHKVKINLRNDLEIEDKYRELIQKDLDNLVNIIDENLLNNAVMAQGYGDSYSRKIYDDKNGITKILSNFSSSPFNVTPIVTNKGDSVAYEVSINTSIIIPKKIHNITI